MKTLRFFTQYFFCLFLILTIAGCGTPPATEVTASQPLGGGSGVLLFSSTRETSNYALFQLDTATKLATRLTEDEAAYVPGPYSPDGTKIVYTGFGDLGTDVFVMNTDGSDPIRLTNDEKATNSFPAWSPDGTQIMFTAYKNENNDLYVMNADGSNVIQLTNAPTDDWAGVWSPDGGTVAFLSDRDNELGFYDIYLMNPDGSNVRRLTTDGGDGNNHYAPAWSPDGTKIAFRGHIADGPGDIFVMNADGSGLTNLTNYPTEDWAPTWSPDGNLIAFQSDRDGNWEIYVMNADGSNLINLTNRQPDDQLPFWKP
ncbi:MAG TPA: hypothetical protein PK530_09360 [Anaerolineales bacterium]|nr:hypothetical protein [Anaerolineales bacterium]